MHMLCDVELQDDLQQVQMQFHIVKQRRTVGQHFKQRQPIIIFM